MQGVQGGGQTDFVASSVARAKQFSVSPGGKRSVSPVRLGGGGGGGGGGSADSGGLTTLCASLRTALTALREDIHGLDIQRMQMNADVVAETRLVSPRGGIAMSPPT